MLESITATREHTISCGHRVVGHEGKCKYLHGHNYTIHITCESAGGLDNVGRVVDFSVIKSICCEWLEQQWDHKLLLWTDDKIVPALRVAEHWLQPDDKLPGCDVGIVLVPFNPTAENIAMFLLDKFNELFETFVRPIVCTKVKVEETPKCSATYSVQGDVTELRK